MTWQIKEDYLTFRDMSVDRKMVSRETDLVNRARDALLEYAENYGMGTPGYLVLPARSRAGVHGRGVAGLRTLLVSFDSPSERSLFLTTALHEYVHCWLSSRALGYIDDQEVMVKAWHEDLDKWLSKRAELEMLVDKDVKDVISEYADDRQRLNGHPSSELARSIFLRHTQKFARIVNGSPMFVPGFAERQVILDRDELLLEIEGNPTLNTGLAGRFASCALYGIFVEDLQQVLRMRLLEDTSYEEALCYMISCGITGKTLDSYSGMTDQVNLDWAKKLERLGVRHVVEQISEADSVYSCVRKLVGEALS
jgi:hypothetical protein